MASLELTTDCMDSRGYIDPRYTCDADNSSPELRWTAEGEIAGFAVTVEDPDAPNGSFTHWVVYNIPASVRHLPAGIPAQESLPNGIRQGLNGFGKLGYAGPCPPFGDRPHRYVFRVLALAAQPDLPTRATSGDLKSILAPFVVGTAEVTGRYQRLGQRAG